MLLWCSRSPSCRVLCAWAALWSLIEVFNLFNNYEYHEKHPAYSKKHYEEYWKYTSIESISSIELHCLHSYTWVGVKTWYENLDPILWNVKLHAAAYMKLNVWT